MLLLETAARSILHHKALSPCSEPNPELRHLLDLQVRYWMLFQCHRRQYLVWVPSRFVLWPYQAKSFKCSRDYEIIQIKIIIILQICGIWQQSFMQQNFKYIFYLSVFKVENSPSAIIMLPADGCDVPCKPTYGYLAIHSNGSMNRDDRGLVIFFEHIAGFRESNSSTIWTRVLLVKLYYTKMKS